MSPEPFTIADVLRLKTDVVGEVLFQINVPVKTESVVFNCNLEVAPNEEL